MKQQQFEADNQPLWDQIAAIINGSDGGSVNLPPRYRRLCQCLALARQRGYSPALTDYLQQLVSDCHRLMYGASAARPNTLVQWMLIDFPQRVRAEWRLLLTACIAFFGVGGAVALLVWFDPNLAYSFSSPEELAKYRAMYAPDMQRLGRGGSEGDFQMFGHYIWNNISIDFRTFALGILGAIPAVFIMGYNGLLLGVVGSWLSQDPATTHTFWSFVVTHASFEVVGMLLSGVAGMKLGLALIRPGRRTRALALQEASQYMFPVLVGAALMTFLAAFIEAFWSASPAVPVMVKYVVGALCWLSIILFFTFAGRGRN
ncbi:stage II sporulation protein M [Massilia sp. PAMC28688]|uniref:stage II sporulation protein M n=1 Tax=Massilia sp. PAMC28688 TaxID=2861283 RepID=UPI001C63452D|nr:stage II sporulation protein M [Massilia sp. PAMC28688]QYF93663.1 stage II sporulation protein M [Massilia sp. PAMC28688]